MKIGMIGLGKLGLPVALSIESKGHEVVGYDVSPEPARYVKERKIPYVEKDLQPLLDRTNISVATSVKEVVDSSDIVFVAVQTPHDPKYEGATRIPDDRKDFDYSYLKSSVQQIAEACWEKRSKTVVAVISTCLPGTFERELKPLINNNMQYVYTPQFIAMGTVLDDYLHPEFDLIGVYDEQAAKLLQKFYKTINDAPCVVTDITTAEAIKVSYNTFITAKTVIANAWGEMCHKLGANIDDVTKAWSLSTTRLLSPRYLNSGVGDGGGCHPRDNIALSYIAEKIGMSHNIWEDLMAAREDHMAWLARLAVESSQEEDLPIFVLGRSFKPETNIETGSPAILMTNIICESTPAVALEDIGDMVKGVYVIGTRHKRYQAYRFPEGSVVIDPFRYIAPQNGVQIVSIGAKM